MKKKNKAGKGAAVHYIDQNDGLMKRTSDNSVVENGVGEYIMDCDEITEPLNCWSTTRKYYQDIGQIYTLVNESIELYSRSLHQGGPSAYDEEELEDMTNASAMLERAVRQIVMGLTGKKCKLIDADEKKKVGKKAAKRALARHK